MLDKRSGRSRDAISARCFAASAATCFALICETSPDKMPLHRVSYPGGRFGAASCSGTHRVTVTPPRRAGHLAEADRRGATFAVPASRRIARPPHRPRRGPASRGFDDKRDGRHLDGAQDHQRPNGAGRDRNPDRMRLRTARVVQPADDDRQHDRGHQPAKQVAAHDCVDHGCAPRGIGSRRVPDVGGRSHQTLRRTPWRFLAPLAWDGESAKAFGRYLHVETNGATMKLPRSTTSGRAGDRHARRRRLALRICGLRRRRRRGECPGGNPRDVVNWPLARSSIAHHQVIHSNRPKPLDAELDRPRWCGAVTA